MIHLFRVRASICRIAALGVLAGTSGCALKYQGEDGRLHIVGLVAVTVTPVADPRGKAKAVETRNFGAMLYASDATRGVSIGYNREEVVYASDSNGTFDSSTP